MKRAVSISIGSSKRNKTVQVELFGEKVQIERIGTDGDTHRAAQMYTELDGKVDAFGVGGADLGFMVKGHFYPMHSVYRSIKNVKITPVADGNGLKTTLEARVKNIINGELASVINPKKVFVLAGIDRWGVTSSFVDSGYDCIFGDLLFGLGLPYIVKTEKSIIRLAKILMPIIGFFPFSWLYPTGKEQEKRTPKWTEYFTWAKVIAGDCNYITRYAPDDMKGKILVTNTTTEQDRALFKKMGVKYLVTSTPILDGRSFGTNMMEAAILAAIGWKKPVDYFHAAEYIKMMDDLVDKLKFKPQITEL